VLEVGLVISIYNPNMGHPTAESVTCPPSSVGRAHPW
jgi:hypothetical protein